MDKVLITGVGGFIGKALAGTLSNHGYDVYGLSHSDIRLNNIKIFKADVLNESKVFDICKDKDIIIHLAAITEHKNIYNYPAKSFETSLIGTLNVLKAFEKSNAAHFIFPSSGKVYGKPKYLPCGENHTAKPQTPLGITKKICEDAIHYFSTFSDKRFSILRIFNVYGNGQKKNFLIPTILSQTNSDKIVLGNMQHKRDYIYVKDAVEAFLAIIKHREKGFNIYNVGSGASYSAYDIVKALETIKNKSFKIKIDKSKLRKNEPFEEKASIAKLKSLGWKPKYNIREGLAEMLNDKHIEF